MHIPLAGSGQRRSARNQRRRGRAHFLLSIDVAPACWARRCTQGSRPFEQPCGRSSSFLRDPSPLIQQQARCKVPRVALMTDPKFALKRHPTLPPAEGPLLVCVLDGWGESPYQDEYNAVHRAQTPCMDGLKAGAPGRWRLLKAHGTAVGLPSDADQGNSEVGHNALGAGQIVDQGAKCVDRALASGEVFELEGWRYIEAAARSGTLHLIGLLSDGGVHSRYDQLMLLVNGALDRGVQCIRLHVLADGRDVPDHTALPWVERLQADLDAIAAARPGCDVRIASGGGRMVTTMDRYESDWDIVRRGYEAHVLGQAPHTFPDAVTAVKTLKAASDVSDQRMDAWVVVDGAGTPVGAVADGDAVVVFNFRADRVLELSQALEEEHFTNFNRQRWPKIKFAGMMEYDGERHIPRHFLVPPPVIENSSEEYLLASGVSIFACSESQKIGHVTFFWQGNRGGYLDPQLQEFVEIPSDQNISFDQRPAMKAAEIAQATKAALQSGKHRFVRCNFANPDMVGHTGNLQATIEACTVVDRCVQELLEAVDEAGGRFLVTADHGNVEDMVQRDKGGKPIMAASGQPDPLTSHTLNPVPVAIGGAGLPNSVAFRSDLPGAGLANVTATAIELLGFEPPPFYLPSLISTDLSP